MGMSSGAKRAAREQAEATRQAAAQQAQQARLAAQAAQQQQESMIARQRASEAATELERSQTRQTVEVSLVDEPSAAPVTEARRRRNPRDVFRSGGGASGLNI